jgi:hypothetical protein
MAVVLGNLLAAITWDPGFRGILVVAVGVIVLMGSVYLLLATNTGARLGFLLALTGLAGWMTIMGLVWSIYGIGKQGTAASWKVKDVNFSDLTLTQVEVARGLPEPDQLPTAEELLRDRPKLAEQFPEVEGVKRPGLGDLLGVDPDLEEVIQADPDMPDDWRLLAASDPQTGEAQAAASAYVVDERKLFEAQTDFVVLNSFSYGGKERRDPEANLWERAWFKAKRVVTWPLGNPPHYSVVQIQRVVPQETPPGEAPPLPVADETQPVISVIMERDLGAKRLPSVGVMVFSGIIFAVCCNSLHRRDKLVAEARAAAART